MIHLLEEIEKPEKLEFPHIELSLELAGRMGAIRFNPETHVVDIYNKVIDKLHKDVDEYNEYIRHLRYVNDKYLRDPFVRDIYVINNSKSQMEYKINIKLNDIHQGYHDLNNIINVIKT